MRRCDKAMVSAHLCCCTTLALACLPHAVPALAPQDDVPPFPDSVAFSIMEEQLGRPLEQVFSSISERPVAAASLGQVGGWERRGGPHLGWAKCMLGTLE